MTDLLTEPLLVDVAAAWQRETTGLPGVALCSPAG